jgi:hypothetical protein
MCDSLCDKGFDDEVDCPHRIVANPAIATRELDPKSVGDERREEEVSATKPIVPDLGIFGSSKQVTIE